MSRYRAVDVRLWSDRRFMSLGDDSKLLWVFLLTTPSHLPIPGVIVGGEATLSEQLGWTVEQYRKGYGELLAKGLKVRSEGRVVWLSSALKYQKIAGPKAMKGMAKVWDDIPDCDLKGLIWEALRIACKSWSVLFTKLFPKVHGEGYAQLLMEGLDTRTRTRTGTRTGSGSLSERERESPEHPPPIQASDGDERARRKREIVSKVGPSHAMAFARVKQALGSTAMGPSVMDSFTELRELLESLPTLESAEERCMHVLAVREAEALNKVTLQYFGNAMWRRPNFDKAMSFEIAEVNGSRAAPAAAGKQSHFDMLDEFCDELKAKETA